MSTPDASAIVAAFAPWHPHHEAALDALHGSHDLVAHAELEAYSVLTRLPAPFRVDPRLAAEYLELRFTGSRHVLPAKDRRRFARRLAAAGIAGGRVYDALIAATAAERELPLITCDRRASPVYERVGAVYELL
ncbi:MAG: PIN domain-containing protein [Thermoleophilaceae bacterium]